MIQERVALVLRARKEDLCWRLLGREAPKVGGWAECEWVEGRLYPALAIHFAAPDAAAAAKADSSVHRDVTQGWGVTSGRGVHSNATRDSRAPL